MKLFPNSGAAGIFRGFSGSGLEFHADLTLPYMEDMHSLPTHGQFVLVELASPEEAVLGRITSVSSDGRLASPSGEDYGLRAVEEGRTIPEDLRKRYLKFRVDIRLLGVLRKDGDDGLIFSPSHRRLPHVGAKVAFLEDDVLVKVAGGASEGADLGFFALGEFIYAGDDPRLQQQKWMVKVDPKVVVRFAVKQLVARRSFVFARAGFGKSNLVKLLFANLYSDTPTVQLRVGKEVPVGTVIFDPDGEYYWPDANGRPGLCDVPDLQDQVVVFTGKDAPSDFYGSFVAGKVKLDIRELPAPLVLSIALGEEKQGQQNVQKLKGLKGQDWRDIVDEVHKNRNSADEGLFRNKLNLVQGQDAEMLAARANMTNVVSMLHDPSSSMLSSLVSALKAGKLCVVDISQMRGTAGLALSGIVLRHIFNQNQEEFTRSNPEPIPTIAVVEEAQTVLKGGSGDAAYEEWVKEGRKYNLGSLLITQQPGSIPAELLSQGDNWFIFHLLSAGDLRAVKNANAHFSDDLLSSLLNEPLPGNGVFWSSVPGATDEAGNAYPIPIRVLSFEGSNTMLDPDFNRDSVPTFASSLALENRQRIDTARAAVSRTPTAGAPDEVAGTAVDAGADEEPESSVTAEIDLGELYRQAAIEHFRKDDEVWENISRWDHSVPWMGVLSSLEESLKANDVPDANRAAHDLVTRALDEVVGSGRWETEMRPRKNDPTSNTSWIVINADFDLDSRTDS